MVTFWGIETVSLHVIYASCQQITCSPLQGSSQPDAGLVQAVTWFRVVVQPLCPLWWQRGVWGGLGENLVEVLQGAEGQAGWGWVRSRFRWLKSLPDSRRWNIFKLGKSEV